MFNLSFYGQTIIGKIRGRNNEKIELAQLTIKDSANAKGISEFYIIRNGIINFTIKKKYQNIFIEIIANNYLKINYFEKNVNSNQVFNYEISLEKDNVLLLKEVRVKSKIRPFTERGDTISFNVSSYKNLGDRKIQDVIKKMPGMEVNENTGEIKFKGKSVETVQLDGEDLFSGNYTTGTKNINVDLIDKVQAIVNFSGNSLLKGIEADGKVALNLKLKKNINDYSGNINSSLGLFNEKKIASDFGADFLGITNKIKSFGLYNFNNIAKNYTPFDYFGNSFNETEKDLSQYKTKKVISEFNFLNSLNNNRTVLNATNFFNFNISYKKNVQTYLKINLYLVKDNIVSENYSESKNSFNNDLFITSDLSNSNKNPFLLRSDIEYKYFVSKTSSIEYNFKISNETINSFTDNLQNNIDLQSINLVSKDFFLKSNLIYTKRLNSRNAFQLNFNQNFDNLNQNLEIKYNNNFTLAKQQEITSKRYFIDTQGLLIGKLNNVKYDFKVGLEIVNNPFNSFLNDIETIRNILVYSHNKFYIKSNFSYILNKFKITSSLNITNLYQDLKYKNNNPNLNLNCLNFFLEPNLNLSYKFNNSSLLNFNSSYNVNTNIENYFFTEEILVNNRLKIKNLPTLNLQKKVFSSLNYSFYDLSKFYKIIFGSSYSISSGNYFSKININQNSNITQKFYLPENLKTLSFNSSIEKFIPNLESTFKFSSDFNVTYYKNIINNSELRENKNQSINTEFFIGTAFDGFFNFENNFKYSLNTIFSENVNFQNKFITNSFKVYFRPSKKIFSQITYDYYLPNKSNNYHFLDLFLRYLPKNKKYSYSLNVRNIFNNISFVENEVSDFSTTSFSSNILPRSILFTINLSF